MVRNVRRRRRPQAVVLVLLALLAVLAPAPPALAAPGTTLTGTVTSEGTALADAKVGFFSRSGVRLAGTRTDEAGRFRLRVRSTAPGLLWAGRFPQRGATVVLHGSRYVRGVIGATRPAGDAPAIASARQLATAARIAAAGPVRFRLQRPGRLRGTVPAGAVGRVEVAVLRLDGTLASFAAVDADGTWGSSGMAPGRYRVEARSDGALPSVSEPVRVRAGTTRPVVLGAFERGAAVRGRLTLDGAGVVQEVVVRPPLRDVDPLRGVQERRVRSDADGRFEVAGLVPGDWTVRTIDLHDGSSPGVLPLERTITIAAPEQTVPLDLPATAAAAVTGTVTGPDRDGAVVQAQRPDGTIASSTRVDASGGFTLAGLVPGDRYRVVAADDALAPQRWGETAAIGGGPAVTVDPGTRPTFVLSGGAAAGATRIRAVAEGGQWLVAQVRGGRYRIAGVLPGRYAVSANGPGRLETTVEVEVEQDVVRALRAGPEQARLRLTVRQGGLSGRSSASVLLRDDDGSLVFAQHDAAVPGTRYAYAGAAGRYRLEAHGIPAPVGDGPWYVTAPTGGFRLRAGRTTDLGVLDLPIRGG